MKIAVVLLVCLSLGACKLVDQTTFAPTPEAEPPAPPPAPVKVDARTPLMTIGFDTPHPHYQPLLRYAIVAAERRDPHVDYDVVVILPTGDNVAAAQQSGVEVMRAIMAQHVSASRVHLGLRMEPASSVREIRVYVR